MAESIAKLSSFGQAPVDSGAIKARAETEVPTKIPHGHPDLHSGSNVHPVPVTQDSASSGAGTEEVTLVGRNLSSNGVQVAEGGGISNLKMLAVILPNAVNEQVVSQGSWGTVQRLDQPRPWVEQKSHHGHAEGAALGNAAGVEMGHAQASTHSIVVDTRRMEVSVGS